MQSRRSNNADWFLGSTWNVLDIDAPSHITATGSFLIIQFELRLRCHVQRVITDRDEIERSQELIIGRPYPIDIIRLNSDSAVADYCFSSDPLSSVARLTGARFDHRDAQVLSDYAKNASPTSANPSNFLQSPPAPAPRAPPPIIRFLESCIVWPRRGN